MGSNKQQKQIEDHKSVQDDQDQNEEQDRISIFMKSNGYETVDQQNHILIYEDDRLINDYKYKSDFITDYQRFSHKIQGYQD